MARGRRRASDQPTALDHLPGNRSAEARERIANPVGEGPVYVSLGMEALPPAPGGYAPLRDDVRRGRRYYHKTLWAISPKYPHVVMIRGKALIGKRRPLLFAVGKRRLMLASVFRIRGGRGWRVTPSTTALPGPGCYSFHIAGPDLRRQIVFLAKR